MTHEKTVSIVRKFLKQAQAWLDKTPGALSVSMEIDGKTVVLAEKKRKK